jgi:hypothetical protein
MMRQANILGFLQCQVTETTQILAIGPSMNISPEHAQTMRIAMLIFTWCITSTKASVWQKSLKESIKISFAPRITNFPGLDPGE